jgi:molybdate transport system substrate-binding protein
MFLRVRAVAILALLLQCASASGAEPVRVFAAASLTDALTAVAAAWQQRGHAAPQLVFGGSATLARQVESGAPADVFASADARWMDHLQQAGRLEPGTRIDLLGNALVLVAPKGRAFKVEVQRNFRFTDAFKGKFCMGEPGVVPVGTYGRQALQNLGWWDALQGRVVGSDDVRAALAFVARGECAAGLVYATDAAASDQVEIVASLPVTLHAPIVYPFALLKDAPPAAAQFLAFVRSEEAMTIFLRYGFVRARTGP